MDTARSQGNVDAKWDIMETTATNATLIQDVKMETVIDHGNAIASIYHNELF